MKNINPPWNICPEKNTTYVCAMDGGAIIAEVSDTRVRNPNMRRSISALFSASPEMYKVISDFIDEHNAKYGGYCGCETCVKFKHVLNKADGKIPHAPAI